MEPGLGQTQEPSVTVAFTPLITALFNVSNLYSENVQLRQQIGNLSAANDALAQQVQNFVRNTLTPEQAQAVLDIDAAESKVIDMVDWRNRPKRDI